MTSTKEGIVTEETLSEQQTEEESSMTETAIETTEIEETETDNKEIEEVKRYAEEVGIQAKGKGYNNDSVTWILYEDGRLVVEGEGDFSEVYNPSGGIYNDQTKRYKIPWDSYISYVKTIEFKVNKMTNFGSLFYDHRNLTAVDFSGCDMSTVTNMEHMFYGCDSLTSLDVNGWDTSNVQYMKYMFGRSGLKSLDLSTLNTSSVKGMAFMFEGCKSLTELK